MPNVIVIALIGLFGTIIGAMINAYPSIKSCKDKTPLKKPAKIVQSNNKLNLRKLLRGATVGFFIGVLGGILLLSLTFGNVDLGSELQVARSMPTSEAGTSKIFSHHPPTVVKYIYVNPDDSLQMVETVCLGVIKRDITHLFNALNLSSRSSYYSDTMIVPGFCRIDFTVYDELGDFIGISLWAKQDRLMD